MERYKSGFYFLRLCYRRFQPNLNDLCNTLKQLKCRLEQIIEILKPTGKKNLTICLAKTMISLPLSSHFETSMSNLRFSTLNTSTCSRILALSCSGIIFIASRAVVMPDTSGNSSTSGRGSIKIRKIKIRKMKIKSALVYFLTGLFKT